MINITLWTEIQCWNQNYLWQAYALILYTRQTYGLFNSHEENFTGRKKVVVAIVVAKLLFKFWQAYGLNHILCDRNHNFAVLEVLCFL